jgi:exosortase/archaeosortase family protein
VAWSLGFFGLLRLDWIATHALLPLTRFQGAAAVAAFGAPALPVEITLACSGADALSLCLGTILAYPVRWRARLLGAFGGVALILALNTMRIAALGHAVASSAGFTALHLYVWPGILLLAIAGYVFTWMRVADGAGAPSMLAARPQPSRRFVALTAGFLVIFIAAAPIYLESARVLALAGFITRAAAAILSALGVTTYAAANVLWTPRGGFMVTPECIVTPLLPVYLAAVGAYATERRQILLGVLAAAPLFIALGIIRLLVVALPDMIASPLFFVHAFYQLLLGAVVVVAAAVWRHGRNRAIAHALAGAAVGVTFVYLLGPVYARAVSHAVVWTLDDPQGAIALLPVFQIALYLALCVAAFAAVGWPRLVAGVAVLGLTQSAGLLALHSLAIHAGMTPHVRDVRAWAVAGPVLMFAAVVASARETR